VLLLGIYLVARQLVQMISGYIFFLKQILVLKQPWDKVQERLTCFLDVAVNVSFVVFLIISQ